MPHHKFVTQISDVTDIYCKKNEIALGIIKNVETNE
jgi:hypothetical protein